MDRLIPQSFLGYMGVGEGGGTMGCSSNGVEGALWDKGKMFSVSRWCEWSARWRISCACWQGVDLCASLFRVCERYGARAQTLRDTNDPSRGSRVLVTGIVMIPTVGEAILLEWTASMHADGIDVGVSAISWRWDLATSVCSEYFFWRKLVGTKIIIP